MVLEKHHDSLCTDRYVLLTKCSPSNEIQWVCLAIWQGSEIKAVLHYAMA